MQVCWQVILASRSHKPQLNQLYRAVICVMYRVWQNEALDSSVQTVAMDACQNVQHLLQTAEPSPAASNSTACPKSRSATDKCQQARSTGIAWHIKGHVDCLHRNNHCQSAVITPSPTTRAMLMPQLCQVSTALSQHAGCSATYQPALCTKFV